MRIPQKIRNITNWLPFGDQRRNKQMWHVNKSNSSGLIFQANGFLKIIKENNLENKNWIQIKDILKRKMSQGGYSAPRISDSRIGTLKSELYQFGIIKYDNSKIKITDIGEAFIQNPKETLFNQFIKLQFTNPQIIDYCKDICLFPIRALMRLLIDLQYLTKEEIGYIVFLKYLYEDDFENVRNQILKFRELKQGEKNKILKEFEETPEGHVALKSASSVTYLCSTLTLTECFYYKKGILRLNPNIKETIQEILNKYNQIAPYPYQKTDLNLWLEYFTTSKEEFPPELKDISFINQTNEEVSVTILKDKKERMHFIMNTSEIKQLPLFNYKKYSFKITNFTKNKESEFEIITKLNEDIIIENNGEKPLIFDKNYYKKAILELCFSSDFDKDFIKKLEFIIKKYNYEINKSSLRGARLEELFFRLLLLFKEKGEIEELFWGGKINELGLPQATPGGVNGNPDLVFIKNNVLYLIELTTQKAKSSQENSETFSIVRHLRNFEKNNKELLKKYKIKEIYLIFSAPIIHEDIVKTIKSILSKEKLNGKFIEINKLVDLLIKNIEDLLKNS